MLILIRANGNTYICIVFAIWVVQCHFANNSQFIWFCLSLCHIFFTHYCQKRTSFKVVEQVLCNFCSLLRPVGGIAVSYRESNLVGLHVFNGRNWMGKGLTNCCYYGCRKQALYSRFLLQCYTKTWQTILCPCQYKCPQPRGKKQPAHHHPGICHDNSWACLYNYMQQIITVGFI